MRRRSVEAYHKTERKRRASQTRPPALFDGDLAGHAGPVVIRADQAEMPGLLGDEIEVLGLAGLEHELGLVRVQHRWVADLRRFEEVGGVELVHFLAAIGDMQAV